MPIKPVTMNAIPVPCNDFGTCEYLIFSLIAAMPTMARSQLASRHRRHRRYQREDKIFTRAKVIARHRYSIHRDRFDGHRLYVIPWYYI